MSRTTILAELLDVARELRDPTWTTPVEAPSVWSPGDAIAILRPGPQDADLSWPVDLAADCTRPHRQPEGRAYGLFHPGPKLSWVSRDKPSLLTPAGEALQSKTLHWVQYKAPHITSTVSLNF